MAYVEKVIAERSTELSFIQDFIAALHAADSRIVCTTNDLESQFANAEAYPTFDISIGGGEVIRFRRSNKPQDNSKAYTIALLQWNIQFNLDYTFSSEYFSANVVVWRGFKFKVISGTDMIFVNFYTYSGELSFRVSVFVGATKGSAWAIGTTDTMLINHEHLLRDGTTVRPVNRIPYIYNASNPAQIEKITGKIFNTRGDDQPVFTVSSLLDCSTVPYGSFITIGGTRYYAVSNHTLMGVPT